MHLSGPKSGLQKEAIAMKNVEDISLDLSLEELMHELKLRKTLKSNVTFNDLNQALEKEIELIESMVKEKRGDSMRAAMVVLVANRLLGVVNNLLDTEITSFEAIMRSVGVSSDMDEQRKKFKQAVIAELMDKI